MAKVWANLPLLQTVFPFRHEPDSRNNSHRQCKESIHCNMDPDTALYRHRNRTRNRILQYREYIRNRIGDKVLLS